MQLAFDIDTLIRQADIDAGPTWAGAPLRYHEEYHSPAELDAAWNRWIFENGNFGCIPYSHMWHRDSHSFETYPTVPGHELSIYWADARCGERFGNRRHTHQPGELPGDGMSQAICAPCEWHHISPDESAVVEAWHDHAIPGWRNLPVVPLEIAKIGQSKKAAERLQTWIEDHYPAVWQQPGHPIITERERFGTRHVPGSSPWKGYDLSHTGL